MTRHYSILENHGSITRNYGAPYFELLSSIITSYGWSMMLHNWYMKLRKRIINFHIWFMELHNQYMTFCMSILSLHRRHKERDGVPNHRHLHCLLYGWVKCRSEKTTKLSVNCLCEGNSPVTGEFHAQKVSNVENVSIWWRDHGSSINRNNWWNITIRDHVSRAFMELPIWNYGASSTELWWSIINIFWRFIKTLRNSKHDIRSFIIRQALWSVMFYSI